MEKKITEASRRRKRKKRARRKMIISSILIVLAVAAVAMLLIFNNMLDQIHYEKSKKGTIASAEGFNGLIPNKLNRVVNILLVGEEAMADSNQGRSDSIILATINPKTKSLKITSLMRDMYVEIPGHGKDKLNAAYHVGGGELLVETVENTFDIDIDGYMRVDFDSFQKVIDELGGVDITLTQEEVDYLNTSNYISDPANRTVVAGVNHFNGNQALGYCRVRYETASDGEKDDFGRTYRQRTVLQAIFNKYKTSNLLKMISVGNDILSYLTTDMTKQELLDYMATAVACDTKDLETFRLPIANGFTPKKVKIGSSRLSVLVIDEEKNSTALNDFINGNTTTEVSK